jgi:hypothetical protein
MPAPARRITGVDAARALAVVGMVMVHIGPFPVPVDDLLSLGYSTSHGKASILFVLLAGVGVSLLAQRVGTGALARRLLFRAAVLLPLGLALHVLPTRVAVIIQYYAVYFVVALAASLLRDRALLVLSIGLVVAGPVLYLGAQMTWPEWFEGAADTPVTQPLRLLRALVLTGYYPALTWAPPLLFGLWLGRRELRSPPVRLRLLAGGALVAALAYLSSEVLTTAFAPVRPETWRQLLVSSAHSDMPLAITGAAGVATAILGLTLIVADRLPRLSWPLVATGQLALTIYVGHLLVLAVAPELLLRGTVEDAWLSILRFALVVVALATLWRLRFARGPLEGLLALPFRR